MTKEEIIEKLIDQINSDMGIFVSILSILVAVFLYFQWSLSDKQIKQMKSDIRQKLIDDYSIDSISDISKKVSSMSQRLGGLENSAKEWREFAKKAKAESLRSFMRQMDELNNRLMNIKYKSTAPENRQEAYQEITSSIKAMCENQLVDKTTKAFCIYQIYEIIDEIPQSEKNHKEYWQSIIRDEAGEELEIGKQFQRNIIDSFNNFNKNK